MRKRTSNSHVASGIATSNATPASWLIFDKLPQRMRHKLWQTPVAISPQDAADLLEYGGLTEAIQNIEQAVQTEILAFSRQHQRKHGAPLAHVAAEATVQPYESFMPSSRNLRRLR